MELDPIGAVDRPQDLDLDPVTIPIVGYKVHNGKNVPVTTKIRFKSRPPLGYIRRKLKEGADLSRMNGNAVVEYLEVVAIEEDKEKWSDLIFSDDIFLDHSTLRQVFEKLQEVYSGGRPTKPRSGSAKSVSPTRRTTGRGANSTASTTSKASR